MKQSKSFYRKIKAFDISVIEPNKYYNKTEVGLLLDIKNISQKPVNSFFTWHLPSSKKNGKYILGSELIKAITECEFEEKEVSMDILKYREQLSNSGYVSKVFYALSNDLSKEFI